MIDRKVFPRNPIYEARGDLESVRGRMQHQLTRDYVVHLPDAPDLTARTFIVPRLFLTDGASIPRPAWSFTGGPYTRAYIYAAIVHDFLYCAHCRDWLDEFGPDVRGDEHAWTLVKAERARSVSRKQADRIFYELMRAAGVPWFRARYMFAAVRVGGLKPWRLEK